MRRSNPGKSKISSNPPINKDPKVFEKAFETRLGQTPVDYLIAKIQSGSSVSSISYLFDIVAAEIALKNHCVNKGFDHYYALAQERMETMKKHIEHNKLVRDRIPQIIEASGKTCVTEVLSQEDYLRELDRKLSEELSEYQQSKSLEELADLLEVMGAVVKARGYTWDDLTRVRKEKRAARGAFDQRIYLKEVIE